MSHAIKNRDFFLYLTKLLNLKKNSYYAYQESKSRVAIINLYSSNLIYQIEEKSVRDDTCLKSS